MKSALEFKRPDYFDMITAVRAVKSLDEETKVRRVNSIVSKLEKIGIYPEYIAKQFQEIKFELGHDRHFCRMTDISYNHFDNHYLDLDLALCVLYQEQLDSKTFLLTKNLKTI